MMNTVLSQRLQQKESELEEKDSLLQLKESELQEKEQISQLQDQHSYVLKDIVGYNNGVQNDNDLGYNNDVSVQNDNDLTPVQRSTNLPNNTSELISVEMVTRPDDIPSETGMVTERPDEESRSCQDPGTSSRPTVELAQDICEIEFMEGSGGCTIRECNKKHDLDFIKIRRGICFKEFDSPGSCPRKQKCLFSHEVPQCLRTDKWLCDEVAKEKKRAIRKREERLLKNSIPTDTRPLQNHRSSDRETPRSFSPANQNNHQHLHHEDQDKRHDDSTSRVQTDEQYKIPSQQCVVQPSEYTFPLDQQSFLQLIRSMIQEQIPHFLLTQQQPQIIPQTMLHCPQM